MEIIQTTTNLIHPEIIKLKMTVGTNMAIRAGNTHGRITFLI